jgi:endonuclease I
VKQTVFSIVFVGFWLFGFGQLTVSTPQLDFGNVEANNQKSMEVEVTNNYGYTLQLTNTYAFNQVFESTSSSISLGAGETKKVNVVFSPNHNIAFNSEIVLQFSNGELLALDVIGQGVYNDPYYASTRNKSNEDLKVALKSIISSGYTNLGYNGARDKMYGEIDNSGGKVTCVYTGREAAFTTRSGANNNSFNCEHTWPQSLFNKNEPERADIHHLFPTDVTSNSRRGSYPFGEVDNPTWSSGGSKLGGGKFEPRDEQKGATARAMFYFAIRYSDYSNFIDNQESVLKTWHFEHLPTTQEENRNEAIYKYQKNRNPFVDHPEFLDRINKIGSFDAKPTVYTCEPVINSWDLNTVGNSETRNFYMVNSGNQTCTVTFKGAQQLKSTFTTQMVSPGEAIAIPFSFMGLANGTYKDTLAISVEGEKVEAYKIPVAFSIGNVSVTHKTVSGPTAYYQAQNKTLHLKNVTNQVQAVSVYDNMGRLVELNERTSLFTDIPLKHIQPGVYFVVIQTKEQAYTVKFLVQE